MGALTLLLTLLGGSTKHEVSVNTLYDLSSEARAAFPEVGTAELAFEAQWWGQNKRTFTLDGRNLQLLRNGTEVTVKPEQLDPKNAGGWFSGGKKETRQCAEGDAHCSAPSGSHFSNYRVLSDRPRIYYFPNFLSHQICDEMVRLAQPYIKQAEVTADGGKIDESVRSSKMHFLSNTQEAEDMAQEIKRRTHAATKLPYDHMEALQIQRYGPPRDGGTRVDFYRPHVDSMYGNDRRIATMIYYLSDVEEGGETMFPYVWRNTSGRQHYEHDVVKAIDEALPIFKTECDNPNSAVLKVKPRKGAAVLFYTLLTTGKLDPLSIHSGCPVRKGTKWISQQWIKESWHEPRVAPTNVGYWELDEISKVGSGGAQGVPDLGTPGMALEGIFAGVAQRKSAARHDLILQPGSKRGSPSKVVKMGDALKLCTATATLMRHVATSHALTLVVWVKPDGSASESSSVTLKTNKGSGCCEIKLELTAGGSAVVSGPGRGSKSKSESVELELRPGAWHALKVIVDNRKPYYEFEAAAAGKPPSRWAYTTYLLVGGDPIHGRGMVRDDSDGYDGKAKLKGVSWDEAELCVDKQPGYNIGEMFLYSHPLNQAELRHVDIVASSEKNERDGLKHISHHR